MARKGTSRTLKRFDVAPEYLYPITQHHLIHGMKSLKMAQNAESRARSHEKDIKKNPKAKRPEYVKRGYKEDLELAQVARQESKDFLSGKILSGSHWRTALVPADWHDIAHDIPYRDHEQDNGRPDPYPDRSEFADVRTSADLYFNEDFGPLEWDDRVHKHITGKKSKIYSRSVPNNVEFALPSDEPEVGGGNYHTPYAADYRGFINTRYEEAKANKKPTTMEQYVDKHVDKEAVAANWKQRVKEWESTNDWPGKKEKNAPAAKPKKAAPSSKPLSKTQFGGDWGAEQLELF